MPTDMTIIDRLRALAHRFEMTATERYEQDAEAFYAETGFMAPGKDVPMAMGGQDEQERRRAHETWIQARNEAQKQTLRDAADALAAAHAARDAAEERANLNERVGLYATLEIRKAGERELDLRAQLTTALRERDEALAAIPRGTGVSP